MSVDAPTIGSLFVQRAIVGVGDLAVSNNPALTLSTYALGSCIGVAAYAPSVRAGGILHFMLPDSKLAREKAQLHPAMFADTGLPLFFRELEVFGATAETLVLYVAGGASVIAGQDPFRIGERNRQATLDYLERRGHRLRGADVGGTVNRTLHLELSNGRLTVKSPAATSRVQLEAFS
jgi:chemotaxis protein CheD